MSEKLHHPVPHGKSRRLVQRSPNSIPNTQTFERSLKTALARLVLLHPTHDVVDARVSLCFRQFRGCLQPYMHQTPLVIHRVATP